MCTGVYRQVYWGVVDRCIGVTGGSVGKLRQSRQGTSPIITSLPYVIGLNQLFFIDRIPIRHNYSDFYFKTRSTMKVNDI